MRPGERARVAVSFAPGSVATTVVVGGATSAGPPSERYETDLLDIGSRTLRQFGPAGLRPVDGPWSWLPDGSLLAYRPAGAFGGDPGIYVVAPDGSAKKVLSAGTALGVIAVEPGQRGHAGLQAFLVGQGVEPVPELLAQLPC